MAISFRGFTRSPICIGNDSTTQYVFAFQNGAASRVNVNIRRLSLQNDALTVSAVVMPLLRVSRGTSISGGVILDKQSANTTQTSDSNIIVRAPIQEMSRLTGTPGATIWTQFIQRMHTAAEQQQGDDRNMLTTLIADTGREFKLRPGESLLAQITTSAAAANAATMNNYFVNAAWEEDEIATFAISGTVTLASSPVAGAVVYVMESDDEIGTNTTLVETITTGVGGTWASSIKTGKVGSAFVQYKSGGTYYTAPGSPYLE